MYSFGTHAGFAHSHAQYLCSGSVSSHRAFLALFTGAVPADHSQIGFDSGDPLAIMENMESGMMIQGTKIAAENDGDIDITYDPYRTSLHNKQPYLDPTYGKWSYTPQIHCFEHAFNDYRNGNLDETRAIWGTNAINSYDSMAQRNLRLNHMYNGLEYFWTPFRSRDFGRQDGIYDYYQYIGLSSNRNAANIYPWVLEYNEVIQINSFEYYRGYFASNGNSSTSVTIEPWDETLNGGAGDWGTGVTASITEAGSTTPIEYVDLGQEITAQRFRLSFGDTASSTFHYSWLRLLGDSTPATTSAGVDLTWGLLIPYGVDIGRYSVYIENRLWNAGNRSHHIMENGEFPDTLYKDIPSILVDVGDFTDNSTVTLNKARNVQPQDVPELLNFILQFPRD